jgi:hypothetical protein
MHAAANNTRANEEPVRAPVPAPLLLRLVVVAWRWCGIRRRKQPRAAQCMAGPRVHACTSSVVVRTHAARARRSNERCVSTRRTRALDRRTGSMYHTSRPIYGHHCCTSLRYAQVVALGSSASSEYGVHYGSHIYFARSGRCKRTYVVRPVRTSLYRVFRRFVLQIKTTPPSCIRRTSRKKDPMAGRDRVGRRRATPRTYVCPACVDRREADTGPHLLPPAVIAHATSVQASQAPRGPPHPATLARLFLPLPAFNLLLEFKKTAAEPVS